MLSLLSNLEMAFIFTAVGLVTLLLSRHNSQRMFRHRQKNMTAPVARGRNKKIALHGAIEIERLPDRSLSGKIPELVIQSGGQTYPFRLKPSRDPGAEPFHITEMVSEPPHYLNSSNANMWLYQPPRGKLHFLVSGHANGPVCRDISSLLFNSYMELVDVQQSFLVPGASYLDEDPVQAMLGGNLGNPSLLGLAGDIKPFHDDIGLADVKQFSLDYPRAVEEIKRVILEAGQSGEHVLLKRDRQEQDLHALFLPFFSLVPPYRNVTFQLPVSLFETEDFTYLKKVQHHQIVREMLADAQRRKHIYRNWLHKDEKTMEAWQYRYELLPEAEKYAKDIHITGQRDYINAKETTALDGGEENYTSPREYVEEILPSLLLSDKQWIARMDDLMNRNLNMDNLRGQRLNEQNVALLVDSFLRGWPSIFLGGEKEDEDRKRYDRWCNDRRHIVWRMIHRQMERQGLSSVPLTEENTIFHIRVKDEKNLILTPLHLAADQQFLVYLSSTFGMTHYINVWDRRKQREVPFEPKGSHLTQALKHVAAGAAALETPYGQDIGKNEGVVWQALNHFKLALEIHPASVQEIWNRWWAAFSRDTSESFDRFKYLVKAIKKYDEGQFPQSRHYLAQFLQYYPHYLPDPYVLLAVQESSIAGYKTELKKLVKEYQELADSYNKKVEYMKSNEPFIRQLGNRPQPFQDPFQDPMQYLRQNPMNDSLRYYQDYKAGKMSMEDMVNKFRIIQPLEGKEQRIADIDRISKEMQNMRPRLDRLEKEIDGFRERIDEAWETLKNSNNPNLEKAARLAPLYVEEVLNKKQFLISPHYSIRFDQILRVLKADDYMEISDALFEIAYKVGRKQLTVHQVPPLLDRCFKKEYVIREDLKELEEYRERIQAVGKGVVEDVSIIIRESLVKEELRQIANDYFWEAEKIYEDIFLLTEFRDPLVRLTRLHTQHYWKYRKALRHITESQVAVRNFAPDSIVTPLIQEFQEQQLKVKSFTFDTVSGIVSGRLDTGETIEVAKLENLSAEEAQHLKKQITARGFANRAVMGINISDKFLNAVIAPSPCSQRWSQVIQQLEPWLLRLIAYLHIPSVPSVLDKNSEMVKKLEGQAIVEGVDTDLDRIQKEFLLEIGANSQTVHFART